MFQFQQEEAFANYKIDRAINGDLGLPDNTSHVQMKKKQREKIQKILSSYRDDSNITVDMVIWKLLKFHGNYITIIISKDFQYFLFHLIVMLHHNHQQPTTSTTKVHR